ncbi:hypothetical protein H696_03603 [Fonticula alba]|uniref:Nuclear transport factor 2 n=1 Tax=Fonticula alba TaxID=691883 RepID=A0A058Z778_FONAL|nr:hypothetical protein H696_03603 [Fonticula alba]KCV70144.1 hypothetical protein H696_03603 [Fonticula alba]|eukprot:XP_009495750.1 hypothetical protein H696_03603 [Fonticula alba]
MDRQTHSSQLGAAFAQHYYSTFDHNIENLGSLYADNAFFSFEGNCVIGPVDIMNRFRSMGFSQIIHKIFTVDAQPGPVEGTHIIFVTGQFAIDGEVDKPHLFSETFQLAQQGGSVVIINDIFRRVSQG